MKIQTNPVIEAAVQYHLKKTGRRACLEQSVREVTTGIIASEDGYAVVRVVWRGSRPAERTYYAVDDKGAVLRELAFAEVKAYGEWPLK